jgi:AcrR family transcriptional regulator
MTGFREKKKRQRQERIFAAAIELINEKGFSNTRMTEISERAELAVGTLYNYYSSKNDLLVAIMEQKWEEILNRHARRIVRSTQKGTDALETLLEILSPLVDEMFIIPKRSWYELLMAMFSSRHYIERGYRMDMEAVAGLVSILVKLQKRGLLRDDIDPEQAAYTVYSVLTFQFLFYLYYPDLERRQLHAGIREQLRIVIEGMDPERAREDKQTAARSAAGLFGSGAPPEKGTGIKEENE